MSTARPWDRCVAVLVSLFVTTAVAEAQSSRHATYGATLGQAASVAPAELPAARREFLAWLDANRRVLGAEQAQGAREYVYFLIGSVAQAQFRATGRLLPPRDTLGFAALFDLGTRLGLYGAGMVARAVAGEEADTLAPAVLPGEPLRLTFSAPEYTLSSAHGWELQFPYYFMIGGLQVGAPNNGVETETVVLSTLFANHRGQPGRSQATLLALSAAPADTAAFYAFWLNALGLGSADQVERPLLPGSTTYREFDPSNSMNKELVTLSRGGRAFVFAYTGLPGTFEANRADALEVMKSLAIRPPTR
jgi:hypothetical protein